jgi:chemotaxis protein histidine kinase CheA
MPSPAAAVASLPSIGEPAADGTVRVSADTIQNLLSTVHQLMASQAEMMQLIKQRGDIATAPAAAPPAEPGPQQSGLNSPSTPAGAPSAPPDGQKIVALPARRTMPAEAGGSGIRPAPSSPPQRVQLFVFESPAGILKAVPAEIVAEVRDVDLKALDGARGLWVLRTDDRLIPLVPCDHGGRSLTESLATAILCRINGAWMGLLVRKAIGAVDADLGADKPASRQGRYATLVGDGATIEVIDASRCLGEAIDGAPRKPRASELARIPPQPRSSTVVQATDLFERKPTR